MRPDFVNLTPTEFESMTAATFESLPVLWVDPAQFVDGGGSVWCPGLYDDDGTFAPDGRGAAFIPGTSAGAIGV